MKLSKYQHFFMDNLYNMDFLKTSYLEESWFKTFEFFCRSQSSLDLYMHKFSDQNSKVLILQKPGILYRLLESKQSKALMIYGYQNHNRNPNSFGIDTGRLRSICGKKSLKLKESIWRDSVISYWIYILSVFKKFV